MGNIGTMPTEKHDQDSLLVTTNFLMRNKRTPYNVQKCEGREEVTDGHGVTSSCRHGRKVPEKGEGLNSFIKRFC